MAPWTSLADLVSPRMCMSRSTGSSRCTGSPTNMAESWLPGSSWVSSLRIDTGTDATSDLSGRSSWAISHLRIDPAQAASTTSFTVVP